MVTAEFHAGEIPKPVKVRIVLDLAAIPALAFLYGAFIIAFDTNFLLEFATLIALGIIAWGTAFHAGAAFDTLRWWRVVKSIPSEISLHRNEEGWDALITMRDGQPTMVRLPQEFNDYDPDVDGAQAAVSYVVGQLAKKALKMDRVG